MSDLKPKKSVIIRQYKDFVNKEKKSHNIQSREFRWNEERERKSYFIQVFKDLNTLESDVS